MNSKVEFFGITSQVTDKKTQPAYPTIITHIETDQRNFTVLKPTEIQFILSCLTHRYFHSYFLCMKEFVHFPLENMLPMKALIISVNVQYRHSVWWKSCVLCCGQSLQWSA